MKKKTKIINFVKEDIWGIKSEELPLAKRFLVRTLKLVILSTKGFVQDDCPLRASALTLYTLLSIVPIIAMLFGIAKGFGFEKKLEKQLLEQIPEQDTMMLQLISFAENMLANTQGGLVAGIGIVVLFWTIIKVIGNIEDSFNHIWKVKKNRSWSRMLSDYLSLMLLAPVLLISASSITVFVKTQLTGLANSMPIPEMGSTLIFDLLNYLPMGILWLLFSFVFIFMPNTRVNLKSGILAGVITGTAYQLLQWFYVSLQVGVSSYNAIYGSFAALPLFLIWLQMGWFIVLFGAEISCIDQNFKQFSSSDRYRDLSFAAKKIIALQICHLLVKQFACAEKPLSAEEISERLSITVSVVDTVLSELKECAIVAEIVIDDEQESKFQPACDPALLTVAYVSEALERRGDNHLLGTGPVENFNNINKAFSAKLNTAPENSLLKEV